MTLRRGSWLPSVGPLGLAVVLLAAAVTCKDQIPCYYREYELNTALFQRWAGWGCYIYGPHSRYNPQTGALSTVGCYNRTLGNFYYPCINDTDRGSTVAYLPSEPRAVELVRASLLKDRFFQNWLKCTETAYACCDAAPSDPGSHEECPHTWDGWICWHSAPNGSEQTAVCPSFAYTTTPPTCNYYSTKTCFPNATWNQETDTSGCDTVPNTERRILFQVYTLAVCIVFILPAAIIFSTYKKMQIVRIILHRNLIIVIIIRSAITIGIKVGILWEALHAHSEDSTVLESNNVGCRILSLMEKISANGIFACMLLEAVYLHRLLAAAMRGEPKMQYYFIVAAILTCAPVLGWAMTKAVLDDNNCWMVDTNFQWINNAPRIAALGVNTILLADIVRVLVTKLRKMSNSKSRYIKRTSKATVMLVPVFGINILLTAYRPPIQVCEGEQAYFYFSYLVEGLQGCFVALLFCYTNKEVRYLVKKTFLVVQIHILEKLHFENAADKVRDKLNMHNRRATVLTLVDSHRRFSEKLSTVSHHRQVFDSPMERDMDFQEHHTDDMTTTPRRVTIVTPVEESKGVYNPTFSTCPEA